VFVQIINCLDNLVLFAKFMIQLSDIMLTRKLAFILITLIVFSSVMLVAINWFCDVDFLMFLGVYTLVYAVILIWFMVDIYRNTKVPYRWVWILLSIMAPLVIMIAYSIVYIPSTSKPKG
jgi:hypothetical protein